MGEEGREGERRGLRVGCWDVPGEISLGDCKGKEVGGLPFGFGKGEHWGFVGALAIGNLRLVVVGS